VAAGAANRERGWPDERLVRECRKGNEAAWAALIDKYKNLIFSIPVKFGLPREDAADIFQTVCAELLVSLAKLREPKALPKWLMQTTYHQCLRWKKEHSYQFEDPSVIEAEIDPDELPDQMLHQWQREQMVREAVAALPVRCAQMVAMLFFEDTSRPYEEIARQLRLATGSIGFIRGRCLSKLRQLLEGKGFQ